MSARFDFGDPGNRCKGLALDFLATSLQSEVLASLFLVASREEPSLTKGPGKQRQPGPKWENEKVKRWIRFWPRTQTKPGACLRFSFKPTTQVTGRHGPRRPELRLPANMAWSARASKRKSVVCLTLATRDRRRRPVFEARGSRKQYHASGSARKH